MTATNKKGALACPPTPQRFASTYPPTVREVDAEILELIDGGMRADKVDTFLNCPPKRVRDALNRRPQPTPENDLGITPIPMLPTRLKTLTAERVHKAALAAFDVDDEIDLRVRSGCTSKNAVMSRARAILLVLDHFDVPPMYIARKLNLTTREATQYLAVGRENLKTRQDRDWEHVTMLTTKLGTSPPDAWKL